MSAKAMEYGPKSSSISSRDLWVANSLSPPTGGFYVTAMNEASDSEYQSIYQQVPALRNMEGDREATLRKNHVQAEPLSGGFLWELGCRRSHAEWCAVRSVRTD